MWDDDSLAGWGQIGQLGVLTHTPGPLQGQVTLQEVDRVLGLLPCF